MPTEVIMTRKRLGIKKDNSCFAVFGDTGVQHETSCGNKLNGHEITSHVWLNERITKSVENT